MSPIDILVVKLVTGEELVGEVETQSNVYIIKNSVLIVPQPSATGSIQFGFMPYPIFLDKADLDKNGLVIAHDKVVYTGKPNSNVLSNYKNMFSKIVTPGKPSLILP